MHTQLYCDQRNCKQAMPTPARLCGHVQPARITHAKESKKCEPDPGRNGLQLTQLRGMLCPQGNCGRTKPLVTEDAGPFGKKAALAKSSKLVELNWGGEVGKNPPCQPSPREVWLVAVMLGAQLRLRKASRRAHWGSVGKAGHENRPSKIK